MKTQPFSPLTQASTAGIPVEQRLEYWDAYNTAALVGLRCSSLSDGGLSASETNYALRDMHLADISGNGHQIERSPQLVRQFPKESVFVCQIVQGSAYFIQNDRCIPVEAGETIVYDTRRPYILGFLSAMRQFLLDIPVETFGERFNVDVACLPLKLSPRPGAEAMLGATLCSTLSQFFHCPTRADADPLCDRTCTLIDSMMHCHVNGAGSSRASLSYLLTAKHYVAKHLGDASLTPVTVANAVGLSARHLNRLFAAEQQTVVDYIWSERTARAYAALIDPMLRKCSVGEIAFMWCFSSQAHFSRTIRTRYSATPSELRAKG